MLTLLAVSLLAGAASADPAPFPFEVIRVLPSTKQVLVYDRALDTHVLLAPGSKVGDYVVVEISGVGLTLENKQERFTVYPRAARGLVMELEPNKNSPPVIYSKAGPAAPAAPARIVAAPAPQVAAPQVVTRNAAEPNPKTAESKTGNATDLASLLTVDSRPRSSSAQAAKRKR